MGPAESSGPGANHAPPSLSKSEDKLTWREEITEWAINVQACARAGDTRAKGIAGTLAHTLYRSLSNDKKELVKRSVRAGELDLTPDTEKPEKEQLKLVRKVVDIVAADTPAESVRRIARLNREVNSCTRGNDESIPKYIGRFVSKAQTYLNLVDAGVDSAESQNFAMTLLANAKVPGQTFSALIASIVSTARTNGTNSMPKAFLTLEKAELKSRITKDYLSGKDVPIEEREKLSECVMTIERSCEIARERDEANQHRVTISLNDAVSALEDAGIEEKDLQGSTSSTPQSRGLWADHNQNGYYRRRNEKEWEDKKRSRPNYGGYQRKNDGGGARFGQGSTRNEDLRETVLGKRHTENNGATRNNNFVVRGNEKEEMNAKEGNGKQGFW